MNDFNLEEELKKLPMSPGVYLMHDKHDDIIYVGKAVRLRNRVRSYFRDSTKKTAKIREMVKRIDYFEYIVTDSELEALVLECNLIKEHRPKYNTMLKDDKAYPFIKLTVSEDYPRLVLARRMKKDKDKYFGPYTSSGAVRDTIDFISRIYKLRTCQKNLPRNGGDRCCLNYHIGRCPGPCQGLCTKEEYALGVAGARQFLAGDYDPVIKHIEEEMYAASERLEFEKAGEWKELLSSVKAVAQKQKITGSGGDDKDVIACAFEGVSGEGKKGDDSPEASDESAAGKDAVVQVFFVRDGKMIGREHFFMTGAGESPGALITEFIKQFYMNAAFIPSQILSQYETEDPALLEEWLSSRRGAKVTLKVPRKGMKEKLVELAAENARIVLARDKEKIRRREGQTTGAAKEIADILGLSGINRMEAFDISNISGFESVGSMVVFEKGAPRRNDYRRFKIKTVTGPNDYASMEEVLTRRFTHGIRERSGNEDPDMNEYGSFTRFPDLIMMDGGKGQVNVCLSVLEKLGLDIPVCGMVKDDHHRTRGLYYNDVELPIDTRSEGFKLITRVQDEAHRFAIEYHRSLRSKAQVRSVLDDIPGVGSTRRKALLRRFKSAEGVSKASLEELENTETIDRRTAQAIYDFFKGEANADS